MTAALAELLAEKGPRYRTATEYVEAALRQAILTGALPPGSPLRQEELAAAFKVSRMPIREALRQLEAQALVDFQPHKGAVVVEITPEDAADNYAIRAALEPAALRHSLPHLTEADFRLAEEIVDAMDSETDDSRLGALNRRFHMALYARAGLPRLLALTAQHLAGADRYLLFHVAAFGRAHLHQDQHRALLEASRARDADAATAILEAHLAEANATLQHYLQRRGAPAG
ncbi:GntR family transcriptional regulator [Prosthecomicrobium pneumaticum]|uniref:DNA-binding GntR family transcriptional regulator n=1 Tax=Prosthecomicrobium pneumaticum TaxID=81895 RepID=A0A7W9FPW3_9HYPH|nr:GntR family transcriptional regulator [Prosthecomicrobium pneumaticum]MBB5754606.1 DNA-binding GntR family transcriptional regulator [Prosthecomicrobium pneumaticum]